MKICVNASPDVLKLWIRKSVVESASSEINPPIPATSTRTLTHPSHQIALVLVHGEDVARELFAFQIVHTQLGSIGSQTPFGGLGLLEKWWTKVQKQKNGSFIIVDFEWKLLLNRQIYIKRSGEFALKWRSNKKA